MENAMIERVAQVIALELGDDFDSAFENKSEWNAARGEKGGRFRDINEPFRADYIDAARSAIEAMREPTEAMVRAAASVIAADENGELEPPCETYPQLARRILDAALSSGEQDG